MLQNTRHIRVTCVLTPSEAKALEVVANHRGMKPGILLRECGVPAILEAFRSLTKEHKYAAGKASFAGAR